MTHQNTQQAHTPQVADRPYEDLPEATRKRRCEEYTGLKQSHYELVEALTHLLDDAENHNDGDDRSITLDVTCGRAREVLARALEILNAKLARVS